MYTTDEKIKDFIEVPSDMSTTTLRQYIKIVSRYMDRNVGYKIGWLPTDGTTTLTFDGTASDTLDFGEHWINAHTDITEDGESILEDVVFYPLNAPYKNYVIKTDKDFLDTAGGITITGAQVGAYVVNWKETTHTLPEDLEWACTVLTASIVRLKKAGGVQTAGKVTSEKTSLYSITFGEGVQGEKRFDEVTAMSILQNYKSFPIA